jgi:hypothetical protein
MNFEQVRGIILRVITDPRVIFITAAVVLYLTIVTAAASTRKIDFRSSLLKFKPQIKPKAPENPEEPSGAETKKPLDDGEEPAEDSKKKDKKVKNKKK